MKRNKVFICGAGPGDPGLITVKAMELIKNSDVVFYDRLVSKEIIDQIPSNSERIFVGRSVGDAATHQDHTNKMMVAHANEGRRVLRLKGGDPFIFGRGAEEAEYLIKHNVEFEIVPGITSAIGSAAYAGIPLTHRRISSSVAIVTGHEDPSKKGPSVHWSNLGVAVNTLVILMGIEQTIANKLYSDKFRNEEKYRGSNYRKWNYQKAERNSRESGQYRKESSERKNRTTSNYYHRKGCFIAKKTCLV